ncbi:hypothetical protein EDB89DRAFT_1913266 [Lactarius sanguifluus]|nr:hypothetical protein EDB89DRAFT_1913266 [Lactarius sanguifluus]
MANALARLGGGSVDEGVGVCWGWRGGGRDYSEGVASTWQANPRSAAQKAKVVMSMAMAMARRWRGSRAWRGVEWNLEANDEMKWEINDDISESERTAFIHAGQYTTHSETKSNDNLLRIPVDGTMAHAASNGVLRATRSDRVDRRETMGDGRGSDRAAMTTRGDGSDDEAGNDENRDADDVARLVL